MREAIVELGIEHEKPLVKQHVDCLPSGTLDHELGARLTENRRRIVDELAGTHLNTQVDATLCTSIRRTLRNRSYSSF